MSIAYVFPRRLRPAVIFFFLLLFVFTFSGACESPRIIMLTEHWSPFRINDNASSPGFRGIEIDIIIGSSPDVSREIQCLNYGRGLASTAYQPTEKPQLYFALSRKSPAMNYADEIESVLRRLVDTGTLETIQSAYS
jgi:hypothetical protein